MSSKQLEPLRELTADDCNSCADYAIVVPDACVNCGGEVYVCAIIKIEVSFLCLV